MNDQNRHEKMLLWFESEMTHEGSWRERLGCQLMGFWEVIDPDGCDLINRLIP
jgi:hypothetical protein